jgi:putative hemolysin
MKIVSGILGIIIALLVAAGVWYVVSHFIVVNVTLPSTSQTSTYQNAVPVVPSTPPPSTPSSNQGTAPSTGGGTAQIANPASTNCINKGGTLEMREETGGTAGYCHLPDGRVCEEWSLFRGGCTPPAQQ